VKQLVLFTTKKNGSIEFNMQKVLEWAQQFKDNTRLEAVFQQKKRPATKKQVGYMHALFGSISSHTGDDPARVKYNLKWRYLPHEDWYGQEEPVSTKSLSTMEESKFCDQIRMFAWEFLNLYLDTPEEYKAKMKARLYSV